MEGLKKDIRKHALYNAVQFEGKANPGAIIGKLIAQDSELKNQMKELQPIIQQVVEDVNSMDIETQKAELLKLDPTIFEDKKEAHKKDRSLPELKDAKKGKVVMRVAPSPSGPLHLGHAYVISLNSEYCRMYDGKFIIRIEDTNPENIYFEAYKLIPKDAEWITKGNVADIYVQSDRMKTYYEHAEDAIKKGFMYICTCDSDKFKELINNKEACPCRNLPPAEHMNRWKKMFNEYKPGDAVARVKTDVQHPNPAMRDWPAVRINDTPHPSKNMQFRVWPLMNFSVAVDDYEMGITHTIRAKDHMDNEKRQKYLYDYMGWKMPVNIYVGRINFEDMPISCTKTRIAIEEGKYSGWDDIRLPFLAALKRRGYTQDAFIKYALDVGITQNDKKVTKEDFFKTLDSFNKEIIDPKAQRFFFIDNPVKIKIENAPKLNIELDLHPDFVKGGREFSTKGEFYIAKSDLDKLKEGKLCRLMDCLNFKKAGEKFVFDSEEYEKFKDHGNMIIHWLPADETIDVNTLMPDNHLVKGLGEKAIADVNVGDIVQFERFGFARCDSKHNNKITFWFAHK